MLCKREECTRVDQATSRGAKHQRLPRHQEEAPMGDLEALGFFCFSFIRIFVLFFYFSELSFVLKKKRIKRELINVCSCLFNKFKSLRSLKTLHSICISIAYHGITSHNRYIEDRFSHFLAIYFSRNGS